MLVYDIALTMIPEIGNIRGRRLIDVFGSAEAAFKEAAEDIAEQTQIPFEAIDRLVNNSVFPAAEAELKFAARNGVKIIPLSSPEYPERLRECCDAPIVLYVKGDIDFNSDHWLSVVGTRKVTPYGKNITEKLVGDVAELLPDTVIVSGLAYGTDITAHIAALNGGLKTVAVLGNNLGEIYPDKHTRFADDIIEKGGAIVSEFNSLCPVLPQNFLRRNRIIAGLSSGTLVVESAYRGGSLSTATFALGYDRDVMSVPGRVGDAMSEGTNNLILKNKAAMVTSAKEIMENLNWDFNDKKRAKQPELFVKLSAEEKLLYDILGEYGPMSYDDLSVRANIPSYKVSSLIFNMEMGSVVRIKPGNTAERI